jgi:hypothetical protein
MSQPLCLAGRHRDLCFLVFALDSDPPWTWVTENVSSPSARRAARPVAAIAPMAAWSAFGIPLTKSAANRSSTGAARHR